MKLGITNNNEARAWLIAMSVATVVGWQFPIGQLILYPFTWLATYAHEMGHGLTALLFGASFDRLEMYSDASGLAYWHGNVGRIGRAIIAMGGLVGPSIAGALILTLSRQRKFARPVLFVLAGLMALTALIFARSLFAVVFVGVSALLLGLVARYSKGPLATFCIQLLGVQLCLSVFRDLSYMFSEGGSINGQQHLSDSAAIAEVLILPYWVWGSIAALCSFGFLAAGLHIALRKGRG